MPPAGNERGNELVLHLPCTMDSLERARLSLHDWLGDRMPSEGALNRIEVVLEEMISNVVRHSIGATALTLAVESGPQSLRITLADDGPAFDPLSASAPKPYSSLDEAQPGGLGIGLIRKLSQGAAYERIENRNVFTVSMATA
ncbi:hypothetical protein GCM10011371_29560 [Novosphingobium marinum]|uniref:Anti-sigma regulatory factor (Ser/Thr protein kinase) n=1 Tax=Novosphingobium marinum TaxID=1514948 RepID=A0A7Y9XYB3_9SPHN|nr:ATP-binding protein [Novosphingobium marinum]NYH96782.1 anti-sigma regulatory factor (Ser/Thr protein kinase) [Novosphingobium marinum]GGC40275.1 hypothetical protein GCM10011371_29560 [Novosphingobium marinum]